MASGIVADLPTGELEEEILEIRGAVEIADGVVGRERVEQALGLAQVEEDGLAARLDALGERAVVIARRRGAVAVDLDDVALEMLGDQLARPALSLIHISEPTRLLS